VHHRTELYYSKAQIRHLPQYQPPRRFFVIISANIALYTRLPGIVTAVKSCSIRLGVWLPTPAHVLWYLKYFAILKYTRLKLERRRNVRRRKLRRLEDVEKELRQTTGTTQRQKAVNTEEWTSVIKEAKALRGP